MSRTWYRAGTRAEIESGAVRRVQVAGVRWVGLYAVDGVIYALEDVCPHWGVPLTDGCVRENRVVECALHGWTYDLASGRGVEAEMGSVERYDVEEREGEVFVSPAEGASTAGGTLRGSGL